jgi:cystathionine beta-lyase family protein involved in aluminum resistance
MNPTAMNPTDLDLNPGDRLLALADDCEKEIAASFTAHDRICAANQAKVLAAFRKNRSCYFVHERIYSK